jgi:hypothetical protein
MRPARPGGVKLRQPTDLDVAGLLRERRPQALAARSSYLRAARMTASIAERCYLSLRAAGLVAE